MKRNGGVRRCVMFDLPAEPVVFLESAHCSDDVCVQVELATDQLVSHNRISYSRTHRSRDELKFVVSSV